MDPKVHRLLGCSQDEVTIFGCSTGGISIQNAYLRFAHGEDPWERFQDQSRWKLWGPIDGESLSLWFKATRKLCLVKSGEGV